MRVCLRSLPVLLACTWLAAPAAYAQVLEGTVRTEYAEVLRVEPVHLPAPQSGESTQCAPMLALEPAPAAPTDAANTECIPLESAQPEAGPLVLYDVDYVLRGVKYRSRLPYDPGNRLQVQLSVIPVLPAEQQPPASESSRPQDAMQGSDEDADNTMSSIRQSDQRV